jgi:hypothetical protein
MKKIEISFKNFKNSFNFILGNTYHEEKEKIVKRSKLQQIFVTFQFLISMTLSIYNSLPFTTTDEKSDDGNGEEKKVHLTTNYNKFNVIQ